MLRRINGAWPTVNSSIAAYCLRLEPKIADHVLRQAFVSVPVCFERAPEGFSERRCQQSACARSLRATKIYESALRPNAPDSGNCLRCCHRESA